MLWDREAEDFAITGVEEALGKASAECHIDVRLFGKPDTRPGRRMGVALARLDEASVEQARDMAMNAASCVTIEYGDE